MPNHKYSITVENEFNLNGESKLVANSTYSYTGERFNRIHNIDYDVLEGYGRWDAKLIWISANENTTVAFFIENFLDTVGILDFESNGWVDGYYRDATLSNPRFVGTVWTWRR